jgi:hypothetical protein
VEAESLTRENMRPRYRQPSTTVSSQPNAGVLGGQDDWKRTESSQGMAVSLGSSLCESVLVPEGGEVERPWRLHETIITNTNH